VNGRRSDSKETEEGLKNCGMTWQNGEGDAEGRQGRGRNDARSPDAQKGEKPDQEQEYLLIKKGPEKRSHKGKGRAKRYTEKEVPSPNSRAGRPLSETRRERMRR